MLLILIYSVPSIIKGKIELNFHCFNLNCVLVSTVEQMESKMGVENGNL